MAGSKGQGWVGTGTLHTEMIMSDGTGTDSHFSISVTAGLMEPRDGD